jgi:hypothetical protein
MVNALKPLAVALAAVFGIRAIISFGKTAVDEAAKMAAAMVGLQSVVEGTGNSFSRAQEFIQNYVSDGLLPATNAIAAYKNLLLRGYDTSQVEQVLTVLKDTAAFGRQGQLSIGQAVERATEGLKNQMSTLVDNAGITRNISLLWKDYAESIGTTVGMLTEQQKIQAEVNGLLHEARFQLGDAAKLSLTYAGQVAALSTSFLNLRVAIGNAIIPIIARILPYIRAAVDALTIFFNRLASIMGILFGINIETAKQSMQETADNAGAAADAQGDLAKNTEKAGKAAKGALAPFDELNVLQQDMGEGSGGAGVPDVGGGGGTGEVDTSALDDGLDELRAKVEAWKASFLGAIEPVRAALGRLLEALEPVKEFAGQALVDFYNNFLVPVGEWVLGEGLPRFIDAIANGLAEVDWDNINDALNDLWIALEPFAINVGEGLLWLWENVLVPFGTWVLNDAVPALLDLLTAALDLLNPAIEAIKPLLTWLWEDILQPLAEWAGEKAIGLIEWFAETLEGLGKAIEENPAGFETLVVVVGVLVGLLALAGKFMASAFGAAVLTAIGLTATAFLNIVLIAGLVIAAIILIAKNWDWLSNSISVGWQRTWDFVQAKVAQFISWWLTNMLNSIAFIQDKIIKPLSDAWERLLNGLSVGWQRTWDGIKSVVKGSVNLIIDLVNGMIRAIASGLNAVINGLNAMKITVPDWIPVFGGRSWSVNIPSVSVPQIPRLATGAVIPPNAEFMAVLGDQRAGRNIETPENLLRQIMQEEMGNISVDVTIGANPNLAALWRMLQPYAEREEVRRGSTLIAGGRA